MSLKDAYIEKIEAQFRPGMYDMLCLLLKIAAGDGAPARALLKPVGPKGRPIAA
jgi:kynurenine formamidase